MLLTWSEYQSSFQIYCDCGASIPVIHPYEYEFPYTRRECILCYHLLLSDCLLFHLNSLAWIHAIQVWYVKDIIQNRLSSLTLVVSLFYWFFFFFSCSIQSLVVISPPPRFSSTIQMRFFKILICCVWRMAYSPCWGDFSWNLLRTQMELHFLGNVWKIN